MMIETTATAITPPNGCESAPPTPPYSDPKSTSNYAHIVEFLRQYKAGATGALPHVQWQRYRLQPSEFQEVLSQLKAEPALWNFVNDKVHYDYFATSRTLLIRMPTQLHETVAARIKEAITIQLRELEKDENEEVANFARLVQNNDSGKLEIPNTGNHQPDRSFKHKEAMWPGVIIEVAYSQDKRDLARLADDYILGTDGNIRVVVGISIDYPQSKKATLSVWRGEYKNEAGELYFQAYKTIDDELIQTPTGTPASLSPNLILPLHDFAPTPLTQSLPHPSRIVSISSSALRTFITQAEANLQQTGKSGVADPILAGAKRRWKSPSPTDEILSEDERRFEELEAREAKRVARADRAYSR